MEGTISFEWVSVSTEAVLAVCAAIVLVMSAFTADRGGRWVSLFAMFAITVSLAVEIFVPAKPLSFGGMLGGKSIFGVFAIACALLTSLMSFQYFAKGARRKNEYFAIVMICTASLILFVRSLNLMAAFVALECATICLYILAAWSREKSSSMEAATKYLVISGVSGAMFLMGIAFIYGASLASGRHLLCFENFTSGLMHPMFLTGIIFVTGGVLFKVAAFPFQFWSPDVYQGAPTPSSAFFAVASKAAGIVFLGKICMSLDFASMGLTDLQNKAVLAMSIIAGATIIVGNLGGITQINVKRLLAFSGISNAGYMLILVTAILKYSALVEFFTPFLYFYLAAYMFANYALFFVVNSFQGYDDFDQSMSDYRGMIRKSPVMESTLVINLASLSGIPPTAGFFGKVLILIMAWNAHLYWLMGIMVAGSAVSIYYYFSWLRASLDTADGGERKLDANPSLYPTMVALSVATLILGIAILYFYGI